METPMIRWASFATLLLTVLLLAGCGPKGPTIVKVSGVAQRNGQPVPDIELTFHPAVGRPSWGITDAQGRFTLHYDRDFPDGVVVGKHKVTVRGRPYATQAEEFSGKVTGPADIGAIREKFGDPEKTPLEFDITKATSDLVVPLD
jgi:hypothetical protein